MLLLFFIALFSRFGVAESPLFLFLCAGDTPSPILDYRFTVAQLKSGTLLQFCDGRKIRLGEPLGQGNSVRVFTVQDQPKLVIRIPREVNQISDLQSTVDGYAPLEKSGIPTPKLVGGDPRQYLIVERIPGRIVTLGEVIAGIDIDDAEYRRLTQEIKKWMKLASEFVTIGDLHAQNLVYSYEQKRWFLIDYYNDHHLYRLPSLLEMSKRTAPYRTAYTPLHEALDDLIEQSDQSIYLVGEKEYWLTAMQRARVRVRSEELKKLSNEMTSSRRAAMIRVYQKSLNSNGCLPERLRKLIDHSPIDTSPLPF